jgi:hypothetical protein
MKELILNKGDKRILKKYLRYYLEKVREEGYCRYLSLTDDFMFYSIDEVKQQNGAMQWIIEQMQHELSFIKTIGEQQEIDKKWDLRKDRVINK